MKIIEIIATQDLHEDLSSVELPLAIKAGQAISKLNPVNWARSLISKATSGSANRFLAADDLITNTAQEISQYARSRGQNVGQALDAYKEKLAHQIDLEVQHSLEAELRVGKLAKGDVEARSKELTDKAWDRLNPMLNPKNGSFWSAVKTKAERDFGGEIASSVGGGILKRAADFTRVGLKAEFALQLLQPFDDYRKDMEEAHKWVEKGQLPPKVTGYSDVNAWYADTKSKALTYAITKAAEAFVAQKMLAGLGGGIGKFFGLLKPGSVTGNIANFLSPGVSALVMAHVNDSDLAKGIASLAASYLGLIGNVASTATSTVNDLTGGLAAPIAGWASGFIQHFNLFSQSLSQAQQTPAPTNQTPAPSSGPSTIDQTSGNTATPDAQVNPTSTATNSDQPYNYLDAKADNPKWAPKDKWIDIGGGYIKDPNTGTIDFKKN